MTIRMAVIVSAIVALIALALATRVAAQPSDKFVKHVKIAPSRDVPAQLAPCRFGRDWPYICSYTINSGHLYLSVMADGGSTSSRQS